MRKGLFFVMVLVAATQAIAEEQRCQELGAHCVCSEPLNTNTLVRVGASWYNPGDSIAKECTSEILGEGFRGAAVARNSDDLSMTGDGSILSAFPSASTVSRVLRGPSGHVGIWMMGHEMNAVQEDNRYVKRMAARWYRYYSPDYAFNPDDDPNCAQGSKGSEWSGGSRLTIDGSFSTYNYVTFSPPADCCWTFVHYPGTNDAFRGHWWRIETVFTNRDGPGYNMVTYAKDVTGNGPEMKVIDLVEMGPTAGPNPLIPPLTPPERQNRFLSNLYRQPLSGGNGQCQGFSAMSHFMVAGWDTDEGQRIGPACEIEGGCGAAPVCGDGSCSGAETCNTCSTDCGSCSVVDSEAPSQVMGFSATASATQVSLSWNAATDNVGVTGYKIYRCQGVCSPTSQITTTSSLNHADTGLQAGTTYSYAVAAYDAAGNTGTRSTTTTATTLTNSATGVSVDSTYEGYTTNVIDDNIINPSGQTATTWASAETAGDHWVEIGFPTAQKINNVKVHWAYNGAKNTYTTSQQFQVQHWTGNAFQESAILPYIGNVASSTTSFPEVLTTRLRLVQPANMGNPSYSSVMWLTEIDYGYGATTTCKTGDANCDGKVDIFDLTLVAREYGKTSGYDSRADANNDGKVDIFDLVAVAKNFGT